MGGDPRHSEGARAREGAQPMLPQPVTPGCWIWERTLGTWSSTRCGVYRLRMGIVKI